MARQTRQFPQGKYVLRTPHVTQDGQVYAVYMYYYWKGKQIRRSVDFFVSQKDWNQDANGGVGEFRSTPLKGDSVLKRTKSSSGCGVCYIFSTILLSAVYS